MSEPEAPEPIGVGEEVYIGSEKPNFRDLRAGRKTVWIVEKIDDMGNVVLRSKRSSRIRKYPNVNILAGWLHRVSGPPIQGAPLARKPLHPPGKTQYPVPANYTRGGH